MQTFLIVGLGNPGKQYSQTRHNIGFEIVEHLAKQAGASFHEQKKPLGQEAFLTLGQNKLILLKPETFMNLSGNAVKQALSYYKIPIQNLLVVHDDLDLPLKRIKFVSNSGAGGNNGVKSIIEQLGTNDFSRLKIGILNEKKRLQGAKEFVLKNFSTSEKQVLPELKNSSVEAIKLFIAEGIEKASNIYNQK